MQQLPAGPMRHRRRDAYIGGIVLIIIGAALLIVQLAPDWARYVVTVIGVGLLLMFAVTRSYGALIGGSIVTGVGLGIIVASTYTGNQAAAGFLLSLAVGFLFIWLASYLFRLNERNPWPLIPATILGSIGAVLAIGTNSSNLLTYWPAILIVLGLVVIIAAWFRHEDASVSK